MAGRLKVPTRAELLKEDERPAKAKRPMAGLPPLKEALIESINAVMEKKKLPFRMNTYADAVHVPDVTKHVLTGIFELDLLLSEGKGIPCGRFIEIFGTESSGKTALTQYIMGVYHREIGTPPRLYPYEYDASKVYLASYGLKPGDVLMPEEIETIEDGCDMLATDLNVLADRRDLAIQKGWKLDPPSVSIWDSIAQAPAHAELYEKEHGDSHVGVVARAFSKLFRKITRRVAFSDVTVIFVNQVREKIGGMSKGKGSNLTTPGGRAVRFAMSIRLKMARIETIYGAKKHPIGQICLVESKKNKLGPWPMKAELMLSYKRGIDADWSNFCWLQGRKLIVPAGKAGYRWFPYGKDSTDTFFRQDFGEWYLAHKKDVDAARDEEFEDILKTAPRGNMDVERESDDGDGD